MRLALLLLVASSLTLPVASRADEETPQDAGRAARLAVLRERYGARATPAFWLERAQVAAGRIEHPDGKAATLVSVASGWMDLEDYERARPALKEALEYARQCEACFGKVRRLLDVAAMQGKAGDAEGATATLARALTEARAVTPQAKVAALADVAAATVRAGNLEGGAALFAEAAGGASALTAYDRIDALSALALARAEAGDVAAAEQTLGALVAGADAETAPEVSDVADDVRVELAALVATGRDVAEGLRLARALARPYYRARALVAVAASASDDEAKAVLGEAAKAGFEIPDPAGKVFVLTDLAERAARRGLDAVAKAALPGAMATVGDIVDTDQLVEALLRLGGAWNALGDPPRATEAFDTARKTIQSRISARRQDGALEALAQAAASGGRMDLALAVAEQVREPVARVRALTAVGEAQAAAGQEAAAFETAHAVEMALQGWPEDLARAKDEALRGLAVLQARAGRPDRAAETIGMVRTPFHAAAACVYVARALR